MLKITGQVSAILILLANIIFTVKIVIIDNGGPFGMPGIGIILFYWPMLTLLIPNLHSLKKKNFKPLQSKILIIVNIIGIGVGVFLLLLPQAFWDEIF